MNVAYCLAHGYRFTIFTELLVAPPWPVHWSKPRAAMLMAQGAGRLIRNEAGELIGAVGVTGDRQDVDEDMAAHGIHAAGLKTDEDCSDMGQLVRLDN